MINKEELKPYILDAETGDKKAQAVVREVLRPLVTDTVEEIKEKLELYQRLIFIHSMKYKNAPFHNEINLTYAEQIHSLLTSGVPKYKGIVIIGFRESAKTTLVKWNDTYMALYLPEHSNLVSIVSEDGQGSDQFNLDLFNIFSQSKIKKYFPKTLTVERSKEKKEQKRINKFTTKDGVTYISVSARKTRRGGVKTEIDEEGKVLTERPKKIIFDDIENENTVRSFPITEQIRDVMTSAIDGLDQITGWYVILGNYLSLRGNINYFLTKARDDRNIKVIEIPILDGKGKPTWEDKYVLTDKEVQELLKQGIKKVSIESKRKESDNFETEFMNNPKRSSTYFSDELLKDINIDELVSEESRDYDGYLEIEEPSRTSTYIIPVDSSSGKLGDQSSFTVIKIDGIRYEEVANFKSNKMLVEDFAIFTAGIGRKFNNALIIPERNYPGNEFIVFLERIYNHIFIEEKKLKDGREIIEYGIHTNLKTKLEMFSKAKMILKDRLFTIRSKALYDQFYEYPSGGVLVVNQRDGGGGHFDLLMSCVIGLWKSGAVSAGNKHNEELQDIIRKINYNIYDDSNNHSW